MALSLSATEQIDCGCPTVGGYTNPVPGVAPQVVLTSLNTGTSPNGIYQVTASGSGSVVNLAVARISDGAPLLTDALPSNAGWGFSPDDDRFVSWYVDGSVNNVKLFDLAGSTPGTPMATEAVSTGSDRIQFSPHGAYFFYSAITADSHALLKIRNAHTGANVFQTEFTFSVPPGNPGDKFGTVGCGFSPDPYDRTFVYGWVNGQSSEAFNLVNLPAYSSVGPVHSENILSLSGFWQFSPCGDLLGLVTQPNLSQIEVRLFHTLDGTSAAVQTFNFAAVALRTTVSSNIVNVGGTDSLMATNGASASCATAPPVTNQPPAAAFTFPTTIRQGIGATFTDGSTDPDGTIVGWLWQFGDGISSTNRNPSHTFSSAGTFNVRLQVTDNGGATNALVRAVSVQTNRPPHASFTFSPPNPQARGVVTLTDTSTDDDGFQSRFWSFGSDQAVAQLKVCSTLDVTLTVYDGIGQSDSMTQTIPVTPPTGPIFVPAGGDLVAAIASACPGDVIQLAAGTYAGGIVLSDVTLQGAGAAQTILTGGRPETDLWVVTTDSRSTSNVIRDLTITGGGATNNVYGWNKGGGVFVRSPTHLWNVNVSGNVGSGGIYAEGNSADLELRQSTVVSNYNQTENWGGGITIDCCGNAIIKDSEIAFNTNTNVSAAGGGLADLEGNQVILTGNYIHHNTSGGWGGGLSLESWGDGDLVANNRFIANTAAKGGGVCVNSSSADVLFVGNLVAGNIGGGIFDSEYYSKLTVVNSTIVGNSGPGLTTNPWPGPGRFGAAIYNSIIAGNTTDLEDSTTNNSGCLTGNSLIGPLSGFRTNGDYHLVGGSPAVDAGDNSLVPQATDYPALLALEPDLATILSHDADGDPRLFDATCAGLATVDIGYDELASRVLWLRLERSGTGIALRWCVEDATLQEAPAITGPWQDVPPPASSPYVISAPTLSAFYRLRMQQ